VVRQAIDELFGQLCDEARHRPCAIMDSVFVCNPVMHHLFLGIDPVSWARRRSRLPRRPALTLASWTLNMHPGARVYILPCIAGHVGADAAAVALSEAPEVRTT
jgi:uncharacterized 2Fe-2S/4Fe-4S cluster protein (DUF4445 family)